MDKTPENLLRAYGRKELSFDQLVSEFESMPMQRPRYLTQPAQTWGEVYRNAEEGDSTDVPTAVYAARYAKTITEQQGEKLLGIYRRKVPSSTSM